MVPEMQEQTQQRTVRVYRPVFNEETCEDECWGPEWVPEGLGTAQVARGGDASASLTAVSLQPSKLAQCGKGAQLLSQPLCCLLQ